ncbi:MAG: Di-sulfide bridge nucleocytoplasmic transport domain-containing protein [Benjaminiella poitrasii]|nr:MAG: Di-sulfide bridge nucleocytoplasmic transport domain-containing protein [Benjaminiella poitrasii]
MDYQYTDDMEFEYTNPQPFSVLNQKSQQMYTPPPLGTFHIPQSLFGNNYTKLSSTTNNVCNLFDKVTLNDKEPDHVQKQEPKDEHEHDLSKALQLSPSPENQSLEIDNTREPSELQPVDQSDIPNALVSLPPSTDAKDQTVSAPSHTFIYNAPAPPDPLSHSHSVIYYIGGLFKIFYVSIVFVGVLYIIVHLVKNIHHDMKDKIATYESDLFGDQLYCQQQYGLNRCSPNTRLPAIQDLCREWERCMLRPLAVSKSKVLAETIAEMANGFTSTLSLKTMIYSVIFGFGIIWSLTGIGVRRKD